MPRSQSSPQSSMYHGHDLTACNNLPTMPHVTNPMTRPQDSQQFVIQMLPTNATAQHVYDQLNSIPKERTRKDRACDLCRRKKIRCNYSQLTPNKPCSSCDNYKKMCTFNEAGKKRGPPKGYVEKLESRLKRMEDLLMNMSDNGNESSDSIKALLKGKEVDISEDIEQAYSDESDTDIQTNESANTKRKNSEESENSEDQWRKRREITYSPAQNPQTTSNQSVSPSLHKSAAPSPRNCGAQNSPYSTDSENPGYNDSFMGSSSGVYLLGKLFEMTGRNMKDLTHDIAKPLDNHEDDLIISISKTGIFKEDLFNFPHGNDSVPWRLPPKEVIDHLVDIYFTQMNIFVPIVDEESFYDTYRNDFDSQSMVLLAAICRSSCRIMDENNPSARKNYITRVQLYDSLTEQIKEKFDLDLIQPRIETIQILLLGACNATKWSADGVDWIAMSMAIKLAQELGLHRSRSTCGATKETIKFYKRLWWSAYVIDRWICGCLGRPLMISDADCDVDLPEIDSETEEPLPSNKYITFFYLVKLSEILSDVLRTLCSPRARIVNHNEEIYNQARVNIERMLKEWEQTLPSNLKITEEEFDMIRRKELSPELAQKINSGSGQLYLGYCAVNLQVKRPFLLPDSKLKKNEKILSGCMKYMERAIEILDVIDVQTFLQFGWSISSFVLAQVYTFVLFSHQNNDKTTAELANRQLFILSYMYKRLEAYITEPSMMPVLELMCKTVNESYTTSNNNKNTTMLPPSLG
ncbi:Zn(2)-C6 fungal-specific transcription factor [Phycomyces blakesleeanus]